MRIDRRRGKQQQEPVALDEARLAQVLDEARLAQVRGGLKADRVQGSDPGGPGGSGGD